MLGTPSSGLLGETEIRSYPVDCHFGFPNYDGPKYSFLTETVPCYLGYCLFLPICIGTREDVLLGSVTTHLENAIRKVCAQQ